MSYIYQQIGLNDDLELQQQVHKISNTILDNLQGYMNNGPVGIDHYPESAMILLKQHGLIVYRLRNDIYNHSYQVFAINRYNLELLSAELDWLASPKNERDKTAPYVEDIVYYDVNTGKMLFNGRYKILKKRNKALFDALYSASPEYVERKKLLKIAKSGKYANEPPKLVINEAITNLRKVCGIKAHTLELRSEGGRLRAYTYPYSAQQPPSYLIKD